MSNYILEVKIADKGTLYKGIEESTFGHMYYVLVDPNGTRKRFGWGYGEDLWIGGAENVRETDDTDYTETNKGKIHTVTFNITQEQYNILSKHGKNPIHERLFHNNYGLLGNSCVDYVFTGLHKASLNPYGYEGKLRPIDNLSVIERFKNGNFIVPITPYGTYKKQAEIIDQVRVWQDANHNGITDSGELKTLSSLGITAIELSY
ncbi:MAG: hypothetical protein Q4A60_07110 [Pasteurellaceae bacterium]|nr:hypothetical protein [Pasteurellaceae bacterium]